MAEYITLIGAEGVERAGHNIISAAEQMQRVQGWSSERLDLHERFLTQWLDDLRQILENDRVARLPDLQVTWPQEDIVIKGDRVVCRGVCTAWRNNYHEEVIDIKSQQLKDGGIYEVIVLRRKEP